MFEVGYLNIISSRLIITWRSALSAGSHAPPSLPALNTEQLFFIPLEAYFLPRALQCAAEITPKLFEMTLTLPWCYMCNAYLQLCFNWQGEEKGGRLLARQQRNVYKYYPGIYIYIYMERGS